MEPPEYYGALDGKDGSSVAPTELRSDKLTCTVTSGGAPKDLIIEVTARFLPAMEASVFAAGWEPEDGEAVQAHIWRVVGPPLENFATAFAEVNEHRLVAYSYFFS